MKPIIYIVGQRGSGKTSTIKKLAGHNKVIILSSCTESSLRGLEGDIYVDDFRKSDIDKLNILVDNPAISRIFLVSNEQIYS